MLLFVCVATKICKRREWLMTLLSNLSLFCFINGEKFLNDVCMVTVKDEKYSLPTIVIVSVAKCNMWRNIFSIQWWNIHDVIWSLFDANKVWMKKFCCWHSVHSNICPFQEMKCFLMQRDAYLEPYRTKRLHRRCSTGF